MGGKWHKLAFRCRSINKYACINVHAGFFFQVPRIKTYFIFPVINLAIKRNGAWK